MVELALSLIIFCLGLAIGSFLNVVIIRGNKGETLGGRSHCVNCNTFLSWLELVPLASFIVQRGRCRRCAKKISWQYPLVELACAIGYVSGFWALFYGNLSITSFPLALAGIAIGIPAMLVIIVSDFRFQTIPDGATLILGLIGFGAVLQRSAAVPGETIRIALYDLGIALLAAATLCSLWYFSRGQWMGFGDVKLILATSLIVGFPAAIAAFLFAFWSGSIAGILLILAGKKQMHQRIPFGPFIIFGAGLACIPQSRLIFFSLLF
ncbi:MAG: prepilin peptidase [Candidatus Sungbacteria bacterium]|nr:prepilin peptidase [Candidatus Sungbacteria bacterium]